MREQGGLPSDDLGRGKATFDGMYDQSKRKLDDLQPRATAVADDFNKLNDPSASPKDRLEAMGGLAMAVTGVAMYGLQTAGWITAAVAIQTIPIVGLAITAFVAVSAAIVWAVGQAFGWASGQQLPPETALQAALNVIPPSMAFEGVPFNEQAIAATFHVGQAVNASARGQSAEAGQHMFSLSLLLDNDRGRADELFTIVARVLLDPRWMLNRDLPVDPGLSGTVGTTPQGRAWGFSHAELIVKWKGQIPGQVDIASAGIHGEWPRTLLPLYLAMYASAGAVAKLPTNASFAYTGLYQLLITRGWCARSADQPVPPEEYAAQGFLLDLLAGVPMMRRGQRGQLGTFADAQGPQGIAAKDLTWYVERYLSQKLAASPLGVFDGTGATFTRRISP